MKKILIIDHFSQTPDEPGNNRFIYLADLLCNYGYQVEIVTTTFSHKAKKSRSIDPMLLDSLPYQFTMLSEPGYPRNVCLKRFASHHIFGKNLKVYLDKIEKPSLVYISVPSLDVGSVAAEYCRKNAIPLMIDIQDLWPEAFKLVFHVPIISDVIFAPMTAQANHFYRQADKIIAVSETYKERGLKSNDKDTEGLCVYLGTDLQHFDHSADHYNVEKPNGEIWIAYVGTLGHSYNIEIIIDALNHIADRIPDHVVFKVLGDGPYLERFKEYAKGCKVKVDFLGRLQYSQMAAYLKNADIAVNPICKGAAQSIINKHADYAAAGLPVVSTQESAEYRKLITDYQCGINCDVESAHQVGEALEMLITDPEKRNTMGRNSRRMAEERFDRRNTYQLILEEINKLV